MSGYGSGAPPNNITTVPSSVYAEVKGDPRAGNLSLHQRKAIESIFGPGEDARVVSEGVMRGLSNHEVRTEAERMGKLLNSRIGPGGAGEAAAPAASAAPSAAQAAAQVAAAAAYERAIAGGKPHEFAVDYATAYGTQIADGKTPAYAEGYAIATMLGISIDRILIFANKYSNGVDKMSLNHERAIIIAKKAAGLEGGRRKTHKRRKTRSTRKHKKHTKYQKRR